MDFALSDEQVMFRDVFRAFAEKEVAKVAEHTDRAEELPPDLLKKAAEQGFFGALIPEAYGGAAFDTLTYTLLIEELAKHCLSTAVALVIHNSLAAATIAEVGTEAQKEQWLPRLASGEFGAFALTEPEAGSDAGGLQTRAALTEGAYFLDGVKTWVSNGGLAAVYVAFASTTPAKRHHGLTAFLIDRTAPLVSLGMREPTLGLRGLDLRTVYFEGGPLAPETVLGDVDGGWPIAQRALSRARIGLAAAALGAAGGALELGVRFASERKQFGTQIAHKQAIQNYFADCEVDIESLRHLVHYAAWQADSGQDFDHTASMAKYLGARVAKDAANKMLQVHGGYGFSDEYPISRYHRDVRALRMIGGTDEVQRFVIAREVLHAAGVTIQP